MTNIALIATLGTRSLVIGNQGKVPWILPTDLCRLVELTTFKPVVMGRKTWESPLVNRRPLKDRPHIVISRNIEYDPGHEEVLLATSIEDAIAAAEALECSSDDIVVIGGRDIYSLAFAYADELWLTLVEDDSSGDAHFPEYTHLFEATYIGPSTTENGITYPFADYVRR